MLRWWPCCERKGQIHKRGRVGSRRMIKKDERKVPLSRHWSYIGPMGPPSVVLFRTMSTFQRVRVQRSFANGRLSAHGRLCTHDDVGREVAIIKQSQALPVCNICDGEKKTVQEIAATVEDCPRIQGILSSAEAAS